MNKQKIVIATGNAHKCEQLVSLLAPLTAKYDIVNLKQIGYTKEIIEDGKTFEENCLIKARQVCKDTGCITIADDSGICVECLNGEPGVYSARYAGENATRQQVLDKLLNAMKGTDNRKAYFTAVLACVLPDGKEYVTDGKIHGTITESIKDLDGGLTYDPVFVPEGYSVPMNELTHEQRIGINHRGIAAQKLLEKIEKVLL